MFNEPSHEIHLQVYLIPRALPLERGHPKGMGGHADDKRTLSDLLKGKADAVDRHGTLTDEAAHYIEGGLDLQAETILPPLDSLKGSHPVHMSHHPVPTHPVTEPKLPLHIDPFAHREPSERGGLKRLRKEVHRKAFSPKIGDRETNPVKGHAFAPPKVPARPKDPEPELSLTSVATLSF